MPSIVPQPQSGVAPSPALAEQSLPPPRAGAMPVPPNAGRNHKADLGDYITLGIGAAGVGVLGLAATGGLEGIAVGGALLAKNAQTAAKAFTPKLVEDWKAGADRLKTAAEFGRVAAEQTTAALTDYARGTVVGAGVSGAAALAQHLVHSLTSHAGADADANKAPVECAGRR